MWMCCYRYLRNREALQQSPQEGVAMTKQPQDTCTEGGVATTSLNEVGTMTPISESCALTHFSLTACGLHILSFPGGPAPCL